ncbi:MAG: helix-turn-helix transcriptional regulator [Treponema sp.]|nr:helix-turn-helix transcriptional regulator [Candidatus Treponema equifaecale]
MRTVTFLKPVVDLKATGNKIKSLRIENGYTVRDLQDIFGFDYPQAVYSWEQGKNIPAIDNLLVLARLFGVAIDEIVMSREIEVEILCRSDKVEQLCNKNCDVCKYKLSA